jgi:hypothetical protein
LTKPTYKSVKRDRLFFDKYQYTVRLYIEHASIFRELPDDYVNALATARHRLHDRLVWESRRNSTQRKKFPLEYTAAIESLVEHLCLTTDKKVMISYRTLYIYANDLEFLESIDKIFPISSRKEAVIDRKRGTVISKANPYMFRSFLKQRKLTDEQKQWLSNWINNQSEMRANSSLLSFCQKPSDRRTYGHFYFEHSSMRSVLMLSLIIPDLVRETKQIVNSQ